MDLQGSFEYLGLNGFLLSPAEQAALSCSLLRLSQQAGAPVRFWGKVLGYKNDYMVAQATPVAGHAPVAVDDLGLRQSWYSVDGGHSWTSLEIGGPIYKLPKGESLPASHENRENYCEQIRGRFWGLPDFEYKVKEEMPEPDPDVAPAPPPKEAAEEEEEKEEEEPADEEEDKGEEEGEGGAEGAEGEGAEDEAAAPKKKKKRFMLVCTRESTRLAHFVAQHDFHCQVVPHGQYMLTSQDPARPLSVAVNQTWEGLQPTEADDLASYLHFRPPTGAVAKCPGRVFNSALDFMEGIDTDIPSGVWSLQYDPGLGIVVGKNLLFQGSLFYHRPRTAVFGQYYFGSGQRNLDLCFMLPTEKAAAKKG